eukprot:4754390-Alexandrium_andersonii.AAC.1
MRDFVADSREAWRTIAEVHGKRIPREGLLRRGGARPPPGHPPGGAGALPPRPRGVGTGLGSAPVGAPPVGARWADAGGCLLYTSPSPRD